MLLRTCLLSWMRMICSGIANIIIGVALPFEIHLIISYKNNHRHFVSFCTSTCIYCIIIKKFYLAVMMVANGYNYIEWLSRAHD